MNLSSQRPEEAPDTTPERRAARLTVFLVGTEPLLLQAGGNEPPHGNERGTFLALTSLRDGTWDRLPGVSPKATEPP
jgi:hypothetical protein